MKLHAKRKLTEEPSAGRKEKLRYSKDVLQKQIGRTAESIDLTAHEADTSVHGVAGAVVGTTDTQTLTNKTLGSFTVSSAGVITGAGTGTNGIKLKNLKNSAASALSGTQLNIEIDIGGTPYYFTVYPTKA